MGKPWYGAELKGELKGLRYPFYFADFETMLSEAQLDGVVIATPPRTHRDIAVACLDAGVAVRAEQRQVLVGGAVSESG